VRTRRHGDPRSHESLPIALPAPSQAQSQRPPGQRQAALPLEPSGARQVRHHPPSGDPPHLYRGGDSMDARGACWAPLQLERARVLVPLHLPVTRRSGLTQTHKPHSSHHGASLQHHRTHPTSGLHLLWPAVHGSFFFFFKGRSPR
jgi:hypothetical protein